MNKTETKRLERELMTEAERLTAERTALTDKLMAVDRRLNHVKRSLAGVKALLGEVPESQLLPGADGAILSPINPGNSITEGIRQLFQLNQVLSAPLIRDALVNAGIGSKDNNFLIVIHNSLKRLAYAGEIRAVRKGRKIVYESVGTLERALSEHAAKHGK